MVEMGVEGRPRVLGRHGALQSRTDMPEIVPKQQWARD